MFVAVTFDTGFWSFWFIIFATLTTALFDFATVDFTVEVAAAVDLFSSDLLSRVVSGDDLAVGWSDDDEEVDEDKTSSDLGLLDADDGDEDDSLVVDDFDGFNVAVDADDVVAVAGVSFFVDCLLALDDDAVPESALFWFAAAVGPDVDSGCWGVGLRKKSWRNFDLQTLRGKLAILLINNETC